ncbi:sulfotransferase [Mangrovivirga sp. M17]|uniref:Sulfotransferase n=1 Tax=Mangrovivirga halotolerans TaxID=2993936 RepID=A0ABT3RTV2_9BACT|nr:sulfotransferase [Mangrovivirga halotolerans]MCX2745066.1 sulfotransferase [Mangrovivirga halotolerans]
MASPFHLYEKIFFKLKLKKYQFSNPPIFIIGHWRSGTTHLHNLLARDPAASYFTTYQGVFPNNLKSKLIFKSFMRLSMPGKRPSDNVKLNVNYPQEDEFAVSNSGLESFYNFFYFPHLYKTFYESGVVFTEDEEAFHWLKGYEKLLKKAALNTGNGRLIVKNPVNTARIKYLEKYFKESKFIFIYRNPIIVFLSTRSFFYSLFPSLTLQEIDKEYINEIVIDLYKRLMDDYFQLKDEISENKIIEIKFEDLEKQPIEELKEIYSKFIQVDFKEIRPHFEAYLNSRKGYKKNEYSISSTELDEIVNHLKPYMEKLGYDIPENLKVLN